MGFWDSTEGEITGDSDKAFVKNFSSIPDNTKALARIEEFKNDEYNGTRHLKIKWVLTDGEFKGATVFQKLKVYDNNEKARFRALNFFKLLYSLCNTKPVHGGEPTDQDLLQFVNKTLGIKVNEIVGSENGKIYNFVSEIHSPQGFKSESGKHIENTAIVKPPVNDNFQQYQNMQSTVSDDDIPF